VSLPDSELERLLLALLRLLSPADGMDGAVTRAAARDGSVVRAADSPRVALSASEARALIELGAAHGIAQGQLAGLLGLEKSTVSRLAAGLEHKGWIRRGRDDDDQRYVRLYLTAEGAAVARQVWQAWQTRQARILAGLSAQERHGLTAGLRGLMRGLAAESSGAGGPADSGPAADDGGLAAVGGAALE